MSTLLPAPMVELERPAPKGYTHGTDRLVPPEQTLERVAPWLREAGITRVANLTGLDRIGIPVFSVCRPNSRSVSVAQGKGLTEQAAKASGVMEAIECFHAENVTLPLRLASQRELESEGLSTCVSLPRVSGFPFDRFTRILWLESRVLYSSQSVWIPYEVVHTDYRLPLPSGSGRFLMSSNGLASGNVLAEAVLHGLCELVERDATTLWAIAGGSRLVKNRLNLESVDDPLCGGVVARMLAAELAVVVWETTTDLGIPAFLCQVADRDGAALRPLGPRRGMGCHPRREIALLRALTEAAQTRLTVISGARDDLGESQYDETREERARQEFLRHAALPAECRFEHCPTHTSGTFADDLHFLRERLARVGLSQILAVDLSRRDWPVAVVRVLVPGLETMHDAPGYVPGRRALGIRQEFS